MGGGGIWFLSHLIACKQDSKNSGEILIWECDAKKKQGGEGG